MGAVDAAETAVVGASAAATVEDVADAEEAVIAGVFSRARILRERRRPYS